MPRFAANISLLFAELPYLDRFAAAADAGFKAVEILYPYDVAAKHTCRALLANGLELALINAPPPNYTGGTPGYGAVPGGEARFEHDMRRVLRYAGELRVGLVHVMAGYCKGSEARACFIRNLQYDSYHAQRIHGDAAQVWDRFASIVHHVQLGAAPDRSEPAQGLVDFPALLKAIDDSGYKGWISAEYTPSTKRTKDSLAWMAWR